ncbi:MAG: flagellar hook-basal body complex protein [Deltaproteobacteria bacterium]|jgi:flagellar hook protein FlgE|nr:flagellar hook-basal body complex protein [Deltaproteobacteria bacterium]
MMGSLFVGASGMRGYSSGMQVVSNNLANLNTVGFKQTMMMYSNLISQSVMSPSNGVTNMSQRGAGLGIMENRTLFEQGGFESGSTVTDMGIDGTGYFGVIKDGETHYTRAGNFRFDKEGNLLDPNGYALLARPIVNGVPANQAEAVRLNFDADSRLVTNPPKATSSMQIASNLGGIRDASSNDANPFFAMVSKWNGTSNPPIGSGNVGYKEPITVYDSAGTPHNLQISYDYVGIENGIKVYEYMVTMNPSEDGSALAGTNAAGLLMAGTMSFASNGHMAGMTAFTPGGGDPADLGTWTQASLVNGTPTFPANFAGAGAQNISLDFGLRLNDGWNTAPTSPQAGATDPDSFYRTMPGTSRTEYVTTSQGTSPLSRVQQQDGYGIGELSGLVINSEGVMTARYSNGESLDLYQITLYRFVSEAGLKREGMNHFSATQESGPADEGLPKDENFGGVIAENIEQSNVDMAREFTTMIITQRAFQMNSKVVTTSDQMLQKAMELKR